jgi:hypothetical protein
MADTMSIEITGLDDILQQMTMLQVQLQQALARALTQEGNAILEASHPLVPFKTGLLRSSARIAVTEQSNGDPDIVLSYGDAGRVPYAAAVHEITGRHHPIGQDHYLSMPFFAAVHGMAERLAAAIRAQLGA